MESLVLSMAMVQQASRVQAMTGEITGDCTFHTAADR